MKEAVADTDSEKRTFLEAMEGVTVIDRGNFAEDGPCGTTHGVQRDDPDVQAMLFLERLVRDGEGFILSDTPEYIEGTGRNVHPEIAQKLHRGDFSVQAHIDLHGFTVNGAKEAFHGFLGEAVRTGKRTLLIIHGRGLSSPGEPVLKKKVQEWLTRGHWRKWVMAFASAQSYDGGTGATYILLRNRPVSKHPGKKLISKKG